MGKIVQQIIDRFDGGMANDLRDKNLNKFAITKHFDLSWKHKLVPYVRTVEAESGSIKDFEIQKFVYAKRSTGNRLFGLGQNGGKADIWMVNPNVANDNIAWEEPNNNASTFNVNYNVFFYYKDYIYMFGGGTKLIRFDTSSGSAFNDAYQSISYTNLATPVHCLIDDIAYFFHDNKVSKLDDTSFSADVLTLPADMKIVSACMYGNYLAIGCTSLYSHERSVVFLWDRDSSITTLSERIDLGEGKLLYLKNLNNKLIAIMQFYTFSDSFLVRKGRLIVKQILGNTAYIINELNYDSRTTPYFSGNYTSATIRMGTEFVKDEAVYFPVMSLKINGDTHNGIMKVDSDGRIFFDVVEEEAESTIYYHAIYALGNNWWIAHSNDGSINRMSYSSSTNTEYSSTFPSVYESLYLNFGESSITKKLLGVEVMTEALEANQSVVVKYRKDEDLLGGSWTTIMTHDTDDAISKGAINISGATLPQFKEIQFRLESLRGAVITAFKIKAEIIDKSLV